MAFWDIFTPREEKKTDLGHLHSRLQELLPDHSERDMIVVACLAGLLARVAYIDFEIHKDEENQMIQALTKWTDLSEKLAKTVVQVAIESIKELAGLENHLYAHPLNEILDNSQKYAILETLFTIAASDGEVSSKESEEIRIICKGLRLEHKHFISARATVVEYLASL